MLVPAVLPTRGPTPGAGLRRRAVAALATAAIVGAGLAAPAVAVVELPEQAPGVTLRTFQLAQDPGAVCTLPTSTTPNVDRLMPSIDWRTDEDFGASDNFITHTLANLHVPADGTYGFRVTNDDGAIVYLDGEVILENDGPNDSTSVETELALTAGVHTLRIEHYEGGHNQRLSFFWKTPDSESFEIVPAGALTTEADVVRVTSPGVKFCEGATDTPGDGLRLFDVNPNYELVDLRPEGFEPNVSALDFTEDGDLVVATAGDVSSGGWVEDPYSGELYILEGVQEADGPEDVTAHLVAENLFNPMGVAVIGDSIFVSERDGLTELVPEEDPEDPERPDYVRSPDHGVDEDGNPTGKFATWPDGGNFHEFAFGLVHDEENFYLSLSVAIDPGGASTDPQPAEGRGTTIAVDRETGEIDFVAGGLRTPNGIGWGGTEGDDLFVMDNQGDWLPSSKMVHIEQDRFFNHYTNPAGPFDDEPVTQPVVWIPQNEIGNSPSNPFQLTAGQFAGQMLFGDVTYGGLQRAFLEEVDGEYQGAVFRHTAGLEAGVNRTIVGPDGAIYVGGIGEGGNWGESGKLRYGLQKLTPVNDNTFDMAEVRVVEGGFEIEYTEPVSEETAESLAGAYEVTQWRYVPTPSYGGPKVGEQPLLVTGAELSEDSTTVTLSIDGLRPGHVVHFRSPRPFDSASGAELLSTEAWYTLNSLPGYTGPADRGYYEAEEAALLGGAGVDTEHSGYSGTGFADAIQNVGAEVRFTATVDEAGSHPVHLRYANGPNPFEGTKSLSLYVNGERVGPWDLPSTGSWKTWGSVTRDIDLEAGSNTIALRYDEDDDGNVNIDALSVGIADICEATPADEGYTSLFDGTLESFDDWSLAGAGSFGRFEDCSLRTEGGMGLLWHPEELGEYSLLLDWKLVKDDNGGVFVGFPDPGNDPWVAVNEGYEIQIDASDEADRTTGAIYTFQGADAEAVEDALNPVGSWNSYDIRVEGDNIKVFLNDVLVNDFTSTDPARDLSSGFIGVQNHGGGETVYYRDIQVKDLAAVEVTPEAVTFADEDGTEDDTFTVPAVEGVEYVVDGDVVEAATYPGTGTVTVTARAVDGYVLAEGAETTWSFTFSTAGGDPDPDPEPVEVTPETVVFADGPGGHEDTYTVPEVEGVEYLVDGEVVPAGMHPGSGTVTVTARATDGYVLAEGAESTWTFTFSTGGDQPAPDRRTAEFHLSDTWQGTTDVHFMYGRWADEVLIGDWDGDGTDTIAVRRDNQFHVTNAQEGGDADVVITYGRPGDVILVGDWDGNGTDTFAVRRDATYHVKNSLRGGDADAVVTYGRAADQVLVGDWDGNGTDTFAVRRGATYHVKNTVTGGDADTTFTYGRAADVTLAGDWNGDGTDTFAVQRGRTYHVNNALRGGDADIVVSFGHVGDEVHVGDWNGDGVDTLGVRRPVGATSAAPTTTAATKEVPAISKG